MLKKTLKTREQLPYEVILGVNRLIIWSNGCFNMCRSHVVSLCFAGCCRKSRQLLQRYEKTESHMLVCTDCPQLPLIRTSNSEERCARKCKVKKNFNCRWIIFCSCVYLISRTWFFYNQVSSILLLSFWYLHIFLVLSVVYLSTTSWVFFRAFNFQRHSKKCHLLPFDRFTNNVQKQASINFTLYEKKGKWQSPKNNSM